MPGVPISQLLVSPDNTVDSTDLIPALRSGVGTISIPGAAFINTIQNASVNGIPLVGSQTYTPGVGYSTPIKTLAGSGGITLASTNNKITIDGSHLAASIELSAFGPFTFNNDLSSTVTRVGNNQSTGTFSQVLGGKLNTASASYSTVVAGVCNNASGCYSNIVGGSNNIACGNYSNVAGGFNNIACGYASNIAGGSNNIACGNYSNVAGGFYNIACGIYSNVAGGQNNIACGNSSGTIGGVCIYACGAQSSGVGGLRNTMTGTRSIVIGGQNNLTTGAGSVIAGGCFNINSGNTSFIAGGSANDTKGFFGTIILGSSLSASQPNYTYVNNLSSQGLICDQSGNSKNWNAAYQATNSFHPFLLGGM